MALIEIDLRDDEPKHLGHVIALLTELVHSAHRREATMSAVQDSIDALATRIDAGVDRVVAALADASTPVDLTTLSAAADKLDAAVPVPAPPVDVPVDPTV